MPPPPTPASLPAPAVPLLDRLLALCRARSAASVLRWLRRPDSQRRPDAVTYAAAVAGLCRLEDPRGALATLREMAADGFQASPELREAVREARIEEAWALEEAMRRSETRAGRLRLPRREAATAPAASRARSVRRATPAVSALNAAPAVCVSRAATAAHASASRATKPRPRRPPPPPALRRRDRADRLRLPGRDVCLRTGSL
ncbi:hypothetical protein ACP4OV_010409 [Aristida adscensionis]